MSDALGYHYPAGAEHDPHAPYNDEESDPCDRCGGEGQILVCVDDICQGQGECMHGDGMAMCPECNGSGHCEIPSQRRERHAEEKADYDRDAEIDRRLCE